MIKTAGSEAKARRREMVDRAANPLARFSYFILGLIIAAIVIAGFSQTFSARILHAPSPRPPIVYFHIAVFASWIILFLLQSALIATGNVKLHRKVGLLGIALGVTLAITGVVVSIVSLRLYTRPGHSDPAAFLAIFFNDMIQFSVFFGLAVYWRIKPEFHRRLMFIATCTLLSAPTIRLLPAGLEDSRNRWIYVGVDALILLGWGRDWIINKRIHPVYLYALPAAFLGQLIALYLDLGHPPTWMSIAHGILR
jgi:FtsH-binding integral membrane protein